MREICFQFRIIMENYLFYSTLRNRFYILYTVCKVLVPVPVRKKYFINKLLLCVPIWPDIRLFMMSGFRPNIRQFISGSDNLPVSGRILYIWPDIRVIPRAVACCIADQLRPCLYTLRRTVKKLKTL